MEGFYRVHGSKGWLEVDSAFVYEGRRLRADHVGAQRDMRYITQIYSSAGIVM